MRNRVSIRRVSIRKGPKKMNPKQQQHHFKIRLLILIIALCFNMSLFAGLANAGPTTGQLQEQIDELTAHVNRLRTLIEDPNHKSYTSGVAAVSEIEDCRFSEYSIDCEQSKVILIDVIERQPVSIEVLRVTPIEEWITLAIEKSPRQNALTSRNYRINVNAVTGDDVHEFSVSPDDPIYSTRYDLNYTGDLNLKCELVTDWLIKIAMRVTSVKQIQNEFNDVIDEAHIEPYTESATETELKVSITNNGDFISTYMVTATDFNDFIEPVVPESVTLEPYESATLTLPIRTVDTFAGQGPCLVTLQSNTGRRFEQRTVDFPEPLPDGPQPEYIPDYDGDGDVDFADFSYFSIYWLEGTGP